MITIKRNKNKIQTDVQNAGDDNANGNIFKFISKFKLDFNKHEQSIKIRTDKNIMA